MCSLGVERVEVQLGAWGSGLNSGIGFRDWVQNWGWDAGNEKAGGLDSREGFLFGCWIQGSVRG